MSGKPASVSAPRAGAPRVLVYVADPRQLEAGAGAGPEPPPAPAAHHPHHDNLHRLAHLHRSPYRTHLDHEQRTHNTIYYKTLNETDPNLNYGPNDGSIVQRTDYLPVNQQFLKEPCINIENKVNHLSDDKKDNVNNLSGDFSTVDGFRIPVEARDTASYQVRCPISVPDNTMQSVAICQDQTQFNGSNLQSDINVDRELSLGKSFVNYQFLEQSVSHQSIVNQSISILNQQVGVSRVAEEGSASGAPQLVRTADGVVLAVLPSSVLPQPVENIELGSRTVVGDSPQTITVPLGWRRLLNGTSVFYISPSGTALSTLPQLRDYLQTAGTCKCGLPCPLRPETTFSFDPKVVSKPYQPASGGELTKLCNHKRKLLATIQARAQSPATPATPPPQHIEQKKVPSAEVGVLKKKMKKRPGFPANINVPQLMVHRDRPLNEFKPQDNKDLNRTNSPNVNLRPTNGQQCVPNFTQVQHRMQHNTQNAVAQETEVKQEMHIQKSSHYLTVNGGWITQQENIDALQKSTRATPINMNVGMPVLGTNGQIIGVNTGFNKQTNFKNTVNIVTQNVINQELKEEKKDLQMSQNTQVNKQQGKDEDSQMFCGLNQALTPEVMQKINEQQQIFIQQNQKQIEMAMKGFRTQLAENVQNKSQNQNQYVPQGQLVIQNGAVVKTNPAKTPPWQVKRNESNASAMTSPSPRPQKLDNMDYEESNTSISEDSSGSYSPFPNNDQGMCSRVPPLPQHYNMMGQQWPTADGNKKKAKVTNKNSRKKASPIENKVLTYGNKSNSCEDIPNNNVPSFMDDPTGYLAQQTVLLNNTISRQVGINPSFDTNQYEIANNCYNPQNQGDKSCKSMMKSSDTNNVYRNNMVPNHSPSPNHTPDSSVISDKTIDNFVPQCCKGCNISNKCVSMNNAEFPENMRLKYMKPNVYKLELDSNGTPSPRHVFDDNPVTSSTFIERSPIGHDSCGPIQAGTVSTSNASPPETLQPPEPSPTLSNSSRSTDTPQSSGPSNPQMQSCCTFPMPSPAYSNPGSNRDSFGSDPSTPCQAYPYNSPGPPNSHTSPNITGTQMMHFISNHNVNKNLMEVDNISMVGVKPILKNPQELFRSDSRKRIENTMPGYCPPPHMGGGPAQSLVQACYIQTFVTTMASGFSVTRNTVTSVLAGKANTATTSINASHANFVRPPPPPSVNLATTYAIPNNQPDPFINSVNLPTSYPLHIAGTTAQNMISKSPLEMVQNVIGTLPSKNETPISQPTTISISRRTGAATPGQILISSTGQIIVSNNTMPPPPPKTTTVNISQVQSSNSATNVTTSVTQVVPAVGSVQPMVNQSTVVVNTLPAPFVLQPPMMAVDGQVVQQNTVLPQIVTGVVPGQSPNESPRQIDVKNGQGFVHGVAMLSPESLKKRNKKKKGQTANITNVLQITAPQHNPNIMVHSSPQHNTSPQFSPRGFQLSPNNNISPTPMLQALTIVPGKSGTPAHIVMNGQGSTNNFGSQQIITNTSPSQQINLLQPVNLINNASGVVPNFQTFQQFIVPNIGGMVMTTDGTAIIQDNSSGMPMQLQLQTVNGQNVLTPVQNPGVFTTGSNGGVVIRTQNQQGKIMQSQQSPGAQFLSPNSQVMMNSPNFNGQLSPLLASLSPTNVTFNTNPQMRTSNVQAQEFIQANQMGQTLMVPLSPKQVSISSGTNNRSNSTFVQQNTTIVQQQTTLVSNSHNTQMPSIATNIQGGNSARLSIDPNILLKKQIPNQKRCLEMPMETVEEKDKQIFNQMHLNEEIKLENAEGYVKFMNDFGMLGQGGVNAHVRHSVSTQTLVNQQRGKSPNSQAVSGSSPPDTTTHSPLGALEPATSPRVYGARCVSTQGNYADTTTKSPEPADVNSSAMVQCVSSSEQDMAEAREHAWRTPRNEFGTENDTQNMMPNMQMTRQNLTPNPSETTELHYNQNMANAQVNNQHNMMSVSSNYYERTQTYKRKNDFGDGSTYRTDKIMRTNNGMVHGMPNESNFDRLVGGHDKTQSRHYQSTSSDASMQKVFDRHNLGSGDDTKSDEERPAEKARRFEVGDLVWGPVKGYASWPGKLVARGGQGWLVRWFGGDRAPATVEHARLLTLTEGLEAHHAARTKHRKSRKLNTHLENAIQEAMTELDKKSERTAAASNESTGEDANDEFPISETPKRIKKHDKVKKDKNKKTPPNATKTSDARLRSSR